MARLSHRIVSDAQAATPQHTALIAHSAPTVMSVTTASTLSIALTARRATSVTTAKTVHSVTGAQGWTTKSG